MGVPIIGGSHNPTEFIDGQFVSQKHRQIVDAIRQYDPHIEVQWIPPAARAPHQAAFRLVHNESGKEPYIMFHVRKDEDFTTEILMRIIASDQRVNGVSISEFEAAEQAAKLVAEQRAFDAMEEAQDIALHVFKSPLNDYKVSKDLRIKDGIPFNANRLKD